MKPPYAVLVGLGLSVATAHAAVQLEKMEYTDPSICERFRKDLVKDNVVGLVNPKDLCSYDFTSQRTESYFHALDWHPVVGDPVALTMKIFDANELTFNHSSARGRAEWESYAKYQASKGALVVEVAPFSVTDFRGSNMLNPVNGYVLRSRGMYCENVKDDLVTNGRKLIAFFTDETLKKSVPIFTGQFLLSSPEPMKAGEKFVIYDASYFGLWRDPLGLGNSIDYTISEPIINSLSGSSGTVSFSGVCQFRRSYPPGRATSSQH